MKTIDLLTKKPGCVGHPVVRLNTLLRDAKSKEQEIKIIFSPKEIPTKVIEISLKKHGFELIGIEKNNAFAVAYAKIKK